MRTYILRRLLQIVPTILGITFVVFIMMRSIPGDPVVSLLGDAYTEENAIKARQDYGLDKPVLLQYVIWLGKARAGRLGHVDPERAARPQGRPRAPAGDPRADRPLDGGGARDRDPRRHHRRLAPEHLGRLHGDVRGHGGGLRSRILPRRPAPAGLLRRHGRISAQLGLGIPARYVSDRCLRCGSVGQHPARPDARPGARRRAGRAPHAAAPRQHARGHPHRVRDDRARQGPERARRSS